MTEVATFDVSNVTNISTSSGAEIAEIIFNAGASAYAILANLYLDGAGVVNNSGTIQNFDCSPGFGFDGDATAGSGVVYTSYGLPAGFYTIFSDTSNAGSASFINNGHTVDFDAGLLVFSGHSSAAEGSIINEQGDTYGGITRFEDFSTAANSTVTVEPGAILQFEQSASGGNATLIASGGKIFFDDSSTGGLARLELTAGGSLDLAEHSNATAVAIGSLEGDNQGAVLLSRQRLSIGGNGLSTTFSGVISQTGSLIKTGSERLTLTGANTYSGGTTIQGGTFIAQARTGSATGSGAVAVNAGILGGKGTISGAVTVGTGAGNGAYLAPGVKGPDKLTVSNTLTFKADGSYNCDLSLGRAKVDQVNANGVTIENGAQFNLLPKGFQILTVGTVFTVINNTAATPISGTFANLVDGSVIHATAGNKLKVSYQGGDGNDLTLTVVP